MKHNKIHGFFGTTGHATDLDGMTFPALLELYLRNKHAEKSVRKIFQAFQNKISKRLSIPSIRLLVKDLDGNSGNFHSSRVKRQANTVGVDIDEMCLPEEAFLSILHEIKHAEQEYVLHKYLYHKIIPQNNFGKAILLAKIWEEIEDSEDDKEALESQEFDPYEAYYMDFSELDAHLFSGEEMAKLTEKYKIYDNLDFHLHLRSMWCKLLSVMLYQREGTENPMISRAIMLFENHVEQMKSGKHGKAIKEAVDEITIDGFDARRAFETITQRLDRVAEFIILEDAFLKSKGVNINLFENGKFNYGDNDIDRCEDEPEIISEFGVEEDSIYASGIERFVQKGNHEYEKIIVSFLVCEN